MIFRDAKPSNVTNMIFIMLMGIPVFQFRRYLRK